MKTTYLWQPSLTCQIRFVCRLYVCRVFVSHLWYDITSLLIKLVIDYDADAYSSGEAKHISWDIKLTYY